MIYFNIEIAFMSMLKFLICQFGQLTLYIALLPIYTSLRESCVSLLFLTFQDVIINIYFPNTGSIALMVEFVYRDRLIS